MNSMRAKSMIAGATLALAGTMPAAGQPGPMHGGMGAGRPAIPAMQETLVYRGTVREIDAGTRTVVIEGADGGTSTLRIGGAIRNFDTLRVGDRVRVRYTEAVAHTLVEQPAGSIRQRIEADAATQAPPGGRPGMRAMDRTTVVANVVAVDRERGRVTLRGVEREPVQLRVRDPRMMADLEPGDQVVATYVQSAAVAIEPGDGTPPR